MRQQIGKYALQKELGKGASGIVYLATDTFGGAEVALKVIDFRALSDTQSGDVARRQFLNEASLAGKLNHPHIVGILEAVVDVEPSYIAMEYVPGGNLSRFTRYENLLPVDDTIEIGFKCCGALDYASRHGIVHRDIKPANIMVVHGTDVKVADFGAAYFIQAQATQIADLGTPSYVSPEQVRSEPLTHQSDMFTLGVVLYQLFTGRLPFHGATMTELFERILTAPPRPPSMLRSELSEDIDGALLRALAKDPRERYPTWAEFALELARIGGLSVYRQAIPDSERFRVLRRMPILGEFDDAEIWELVRAGTWSRLPAQSAVVKEHESGQSLFFLAQGDAKVTKRGRLLNILKPGETFGEMAYIQGGSATRQATVEAMSDVLLAEFDRRAIDSLSVGSQSHFAQALLRILVERLDLADARILQLLS